jgi:hypothetical protein
VVLQPAISSVAVFKQDDSKVPFHDLTSGEEVIIYQKGFSRKQENSAAIGDFTSCADEDAREKRLLVRNKRKDDDGQYLDNGVVKRRRQEIRPSSLITLFAHIIKRH